MNVKLLNCFILTLLLARGKCENATNVDGSNLRPGFPVVAPNSAVVNESSWITITVEDIITPSDTCKEIVGRFATAISDFTHCSVTNSRPIHLCEWCVAQYLRVENSYHELFVAIDEKGYPCKEYFTNLDRIEIVTDAYKYVHNLWQKGNCDYCFKHLENGTLTPEITQDVSDFIMLYQVTKSCFNQHMDKNNTCVECKQDYEQLNLNYIDIGDKYGEKVCLDIVDTMNTTREMWSEIYHCIPPRLAEVWLHVGFAIVAAIPIIFYSLAYWLSSIKESKILHQHRLAEVFTTTTSSGESEVSGYLSSRRGGASSSRSTSIKTSSNPTDPPLSQH